MRAERGCSDIKIREARSTGGDRVGDVVGLQQCEAEQLLDRAAAVAVLRGRSGLIVVSSSISPSPPSGPCDGAGAATFAKTRDVKP